MNLDENMLYKRILMRLRKEMPAGSGPAGPAGRDGKDGAVGGTGPAGKDGVAGPSGAPGSKGDTGVAGRDGVDGRNGVDGAVGAAGAAGKDGSQGPIGLTGAKGADGATGAAGAAGKDAKRIDTYTGTTDANGLLTIVYTSAFSAVPSIQPEPPTAANQVWVKVSSTTTGCSLRLVQRASLTVLNLEVLAATTTNVAGASARVVVVAA